MSEKQKQKQEQIRNAIGSAMIVAGLSLMAYSIIADTVRGNFQPQSQQEETP